MEITQHISEKNATLELSGNFTFDDHPRFREILNLIKENTVEQISLDLSKLDMIDSAALGMLLIAREECKNLKKSITLLKPNSKIARIFTLSKFDTLFNIA